MAIEETTIIVIRGNRSASVHFGSQIDSTESALSILNEIQESLELDGNYDLYLKLDPKMRLDSLGSSPEALVVMSRDLTSLTDNKKRAK